jgi:hypothetical protein
VDFGVRCGLVANTTLSVGGCNCGVQCGLLANATLKL